MTGQWGGGDYAAVGGSAIAGLAGVGAALRWLVTWVGGRQDKRIGELEREVRALNATSKQLTARLQNVAYFGMAMYTRLRLVAPDSPELEDWARLLRAIYPVPADTPDALYSLQIALDQLDLGK